MLYAPLLQVSVMFELVEFPPVPVHPPVLQSTQYPPEYATLLAHWVQAGELMALFAHVTVIVYVVHAELLPEKSCVRTLTV